MYLWWNTLHGVGGWRHAPSALTSGKGPGDHYLGCWVGPKADLDREDKRLGLLILQQEFKQPLIT